MKNFLAVLGCFFLAIIMITVFASCGDRDEVSVTDPDDGIAADVTDAAEEKTENDSEDTDINVTEADTPEDAAEADTSGTGSSFLDSVLGGVEDVVGEALGGAANVVEEALAGAADKVNSALNDENKN